MNSKEVIDKEQLESTDDCYIFTDAEKTMSTDGKTTSVIH